MTKEKKVHVIADETLGGTLREYVEVERKAEVGDKVVCTDDCIQGGRYYRVGDVGKMIYKSEEYPSIRVKFVGCKGGSLEVGESFVGNEHYRTLEPSDIVHIEGDQYKLVDRKAEVGERVIVNADWYDTKAGKVLDIIDGGTFGEYPKDDNEVFYDHPENSDDCIKFIETDYYSVLEPIETPQSTDDIIANLVRRVSELERRLDGAKDDIETWSREVESVKYANERLGQTITLDVETLVKLIGGAR